MGCRQTVAAAARATLRTRRCPPIRPIRQTDPGEGSRRWDARCQWFASSRRRPDSPAPADPHTAVRTPRQLRPRSQRPSRPTRSGRGHRHAVRPAACRRSADAAWTISWYDIEVLFAEAGGRTIRGDAIPSHLKDRLRHPPTGCGNAAHRRTPSGARQSLASSPVEQLAVPGSRPCVGSRQEPGHSQCTLVKLRWNGPGWNGLRLERPGSTWWAAANAAAERVNARADRSHVATG